MGDYFSTREGFSRPEREQVDDLNQRTRNRLSFILDNYKSTLSWHGIADEYFNVIGVLPVEFHIKDLDTLVETFHKEPVFPYLINNYVVKSPWYNILDLLQIIFERFSTKLSKRQFERNINKLFSEELVRWRMVDGKFERVIEQVEVIRKAESEIKEPEFKKANEHFLKAWTSFHKRPDPDIIGCMRDAWDAVEIVALRCAGMQAGTFQNALKVLVSSAIVLEDWKKTIDMFYGLACNWVRHPKPEELPCKIEDAEMFLVFASQIIIYTVSRYKQVKK